MKEIKKTTADDLAKLLTEKREEVRAFRFGIAGSAKKNVKAHSASRKEIARILTEQNLRASTANKVTA
ncbi:MAG: 50S ribosomal protein L29 [bacterium]|nr:50S ribosomal protein L29 [bacterium]